MILQTDKKQRTANSTYPKGGVSSSKDSFVVNGSLVFQIKFCDKSPALRVAANRCRSFAAGIHVASDKNLSQCPLRRRASDLHFIGSEKTRQRMISFHRPGLPHRPTARKRTDNTVFITCWGEELK